MAPNAEAGEWGPDGTQTKVITSNRTPLESNEENFETLEGILLLWEAHKDILDVAEALGTVRDDALLAWSFQDRLIRLTGLDADVAGSAAQQALDSVGGVQIDRLHGPDEAHALYGCAHEPLLRVQRLRRGRRIAQRNWKVRGKSKLSIIATTLGTTSGFAIACANVGAVMYGEFSSHNSSFHLMTEA